jgi:stress response protein YsnF
VQLAPLDAVVLVIVAALEVPRRVVEAGTVRLTTMVHAREALVDAPLLHDNVTITRVPIQRVVDGPVPVRKDHGTRMLAVVEAVLVVEKQWRLRKEIHLRTQCIETHQPQRITLLSRRRRG